MGFCLRVILFLLVLAVKYEARLEDGTLVGKSDGVEFTVRDGKVLILICSKF